MNMADVNVEDFFYEEVEHYELIDEKHPDSQQQDGYQHKHQCQDQYLQHRGLSLFSNLGCKSNHFPLIIK